MIIFHIIIYIYKQIIYCVHAKLLQSCPTLLWPCGLKPARARSPWNSPGKNIGVGCHFLLQGIFLTQRSNPGLLHCRQILYHQGSCQGSPGHLKAVGIQKLWEYGVSRLYMQLGEQEKNGPNKLVLPAMCQLAMWVKFHRKVWWENLRGKALWEFSDGYCDQQQKWRQWWVEPFLSGCHGSSRNREQTKQGAYIV